MAETRASTYAAECFWPGVTEAAVEAVGVRARESAEALSREGVAVLYLGSDLYPSDEVVHFRFHAASPEGARQASERAGLPFERIVEWVGVSADPERTRTERSRR